MSWFAPGLVLAGFAVVVTAIGLRAQRRRPERKWPIVAAGLIAGIVAGLAIVGAIFLGERYPRRRVLIDRLSVLMAGVLMLVVAYSLYGPPFGEGTPIESGTIERPERGYRITIPDDWRVEDVSGVETLFGEVVESGFEPDLLALDEAGASMLLLATVDMGEALSPVILAYSVTDWLTSDPLTEDVEWEPVEFGRIWASRIDATLLGNEGERYPQPMHLTIYLMSEDERYYQALYFSGSAAPTDHWASIAETIEYD